MSNKPTIGFIGLGNMGFLMASNLVKDGYEVYGTDVNKEAEKKFAENGGIAGGSVEQFIDKVDIIMTSLPTLPIVEGVYTGENGIITLLESGSKAILIDFSTVTPSLNQKVHAKAAEKGIRFLGVPVSGSVEGARDRTLAMMAGGDKAVFEEILSVLRSMGSNIFYVGEDPGAGSIIKLLNNYLAGSYTQAVAEMLAVADKIGIDKDILFDVINVSSGRSNVYERAYHNFVSKDFYKPGFAIQLLYKDLTLFQAMAEEQQVNLPIGSKLIEYYKQALDAGYGPLDVSATYMLTKGVKAEEVKA